MFFDILQRLETLYTFSTKKPKGIVFSMTLTSTDFEYCFWKLEVSRIQDTLNVYFNSYSKSDSFFSMNNEVLAR